MGQLQAGVDIRKPRQVETPDSEWPFEVIADYRRTPGTRIPAFVLKKFRDGEWTPSLKTIKKLEALYHRYTYNKLKETGVSTQEAKRIFKRPPQDYVDSSGRKRQGAIDTIDKFQKYILYLAKTKNTDPLFIIWGATLSGKTVSDWEEYIRSKKKKPPPPPPRRRRRIKYIKQKLPKLIDFAPVKRPRKKTTKKKRTRKRKKRY